MRKLLKTLAVLLAVGIAVPASGIDTIDGSAATTVVISPYNPYEINNGIFEGWETAGYRLI